MKKLNFLTMCASAGLMLLTACTATDELAPVAENTDATSDAVNFGVLARQGEPTRSGYPGEIGLGELRNVGFGVFAKTSSTSDGGPIWNFMDNQQVRYNGAWTYSPVKYWPNMESDGDSNYPEVLFYAYAPYVPLTLNENNEKVVEDATYGIVELPYAPDPEDYEFYIKYIVPDDPSKCVDLLYGVAAKDYNEGEYMGSANNSVNLGQSPIILSKLLAGDKVEWEFKHALTKFGVTVDAVIDDVRTGNNGMGVLDPNTRILIESVDIDGLELYKEGKLNLKVETDGPKWKDVDELFTGNEQIATNLRYPASSDPSWTFDELPLGVTSTTQYLYSSENYSQDNAHMLIYNSTSGSSSNPSNPKVTIKYHVITKDVNMANGYTDMVCEKSQDVSLSFGAGYKTMLHLHLGLTSVKMDATITDWDSSEHIIDLPANAKVTAFSFEPDGSSTEISSTGIDADGKINGSFKATTTDKEDEITVYPNEVSFACGSTKLLVSSDNGSGTTEYYLPANYTASARNIYPSFGGVRADAISQPALTQNNFSVSTSDVLGSESITLTVPHDFNYNDWTFSADAGITVTGTSLSDNTFTITLSNPSQSTSWGWTLTHKNGLQLSGHVGA